MITTSAQLPPVICLLLNESFDGVHTPAGVRRALKNLQPELVRQAKWSLDHYVYADHEARRPSTDFTLRASGALDPFSKVEICSNLECRKRAAEQFARTAGLLAHKVVLPDVFTRRFASLDELDQRHAEALLPDLAVLDRVKPLIFAGAIEFSDGIVNYCPVHGGDAAAQIERVADEVLAEILPELTFEVAHGGVAVHTGALFHPPIAYFRRLCVGERRSRAREIALADFRDFLRRDIAAVMRDLKSAERLGATLASGSRLGLLAIRRIEGRAINVHTAESWESVRSVRLPWVERLTPTEVVRLREEASAALPRLRTLLNMKLAGADGEGDEKVVETIAELQSEAADLEAELRSLRLPRERGFRTMTGGLGVTIAIYGLAAGFVSPAVGLASLLSLLGLLHSADRNDEREYDKVTSRPAYVLVKARQLLTHDHGA